MTYTGDQSIDALIISFKTNKDLHSTFQVTYETVFLKVWDRIQNPDKYKEKWIDNVRPDTTEMMNRLKQEILESKDMCFTGRLSRLVNTLMGFYSDVKIHIGSHDQINARINQVIAKYGNETVDIQKEKIRESLREIDVEESKIDEWISNIWTSEEISI